jgi:hypothetical protein
VDWVVATDRGLVTADGGTLVADRDVTALAPDGSGWLVLLDGHEVARLREGDARSIGTVPEELGRCIAAVPGGALVGTSGARLAIVGDDGAGMVAAFDHVEGREGWYTPWGGPPDTRSLAVAVDGTVFANVHVGGIPRAQDPEGPWTPTIDVDADVHQVVADPRDATHVVAATARGLAESRDRGATWAFWTDGLHAAYSRAVALDRDRLFLSASTGPRGGRAAVYRREPGSDVFEKCGGGLPEWFAGNIDSHRLAAGDGAVVVGTEDGRVFTSEDAGATWREALDGVGTIRAVGLSLAEGTGP